jgi:hypothetical protein
MTRRLLAFATLCFFAFVLVAPAVAAFTVTMHPETSYEWHSDGSPCPDDDDQHGPCDDGCACHCCHGQKAGVWSTSQAPTAELPAPPAMTPVGPPQALRPDPQLERIFRPPRG